MAENERAVESRDSGERGFPGKFGILKGSKIDMVGCLNQD